MSGGLFWAEKVEEGADVMSFLGGVSEHRCVCVDHVAVAAAVPLALDVAALDEVGQDALRRSESDSDSIGDIAQANIGVAGDAQQYLRVVGDELPSAVGGVG